MAEPSLAGLQGLDADELTGLIHDLLQAEGADVQGVSQVDAASAGAQAEPFLLRDQGHQLRLIEGHRSRGTPLSGVSLPAIAARAAAAGATRATVFLSGILDAERQAALSEALSRLQSGTGVSIDLIDGQQLLGRLAEHPQLAARYFPSEAEAEQAAAQQDIPGALVRVAYAVAPKARAASPAATHERLRLLWTAGGVLLLIWLPLRLDPFQAQLVGAIGLGIIVLAVLVGQRAARSRGQSSHRGDSVMDALIPLKDEMAVGRSVTMAKLGSGPAGITLDILKQLPGALVRAGTKTALLLFLVGCCCTYLLLWGIDPGVCASTAKCDSAFAGPGDRARLGDFMNLAVHAAFFNPPDNVEPASRVARALMGTEFILSAILLGSYAGFFGFGGRRSGHDAQR